MTTGSITTFVVLVIVIFVAIGVMIWWALRSNAKQKQGKVCAQKAQSQMAMMFLILGIANAGLAFGEMVNIRGEIEQQLPIEMIVWTLGAMVFFGKGIMMLSKPVRETDCVHAYEYDSTRCGRCGYDVEHIESKACPECGWEMKRSDEVRIESDMVWRFWKGWRIDYLEPSTVKDFWLGTFLLFLFFIILIVLIFAQYLLYKDKGMDYAYYIPLFAIPLIVMTTVSFQVLQAVRVWQYGKRVAQGMV
ncbi:hypothetical protein JD969_06465 [Planctomycetota bacterium]|nr:hypothetical protein JD969_06465 [Planctomycetota bacterium]